MNISLSAGSFRETLFDKSALEITTGKRCFPIEKNETILVHCSFNIAKNIKALINNQCSPVQLTSTSVIIRFPKIEQRYILNFIYKTCKTFSGAQTVPFISIFLAVPLNANNLITCNFKEQNGNFMASSGQNFIQFPYRGTQTLWHRTFYTQLSMRENC